jgi:hypothetical protein
VAGCGEHDADAILAVAAGVSAQTIEERAAQVRQSLEDRAADARRAMESPATVEASINRGTRVVQPPHLDVSGS